MFRNGMHLAHTVTLKLDITDIPHLSSPFLYLRLSPASCPVGKVYFLFPFFKRAISSYFE